MTLTSKNTPELANSTAGILRRLNRWLAQNAIRTCNLFFEILVASLFQSDACPQPKDVLVLRSSAIGDFICCLPALTSLRRRFPESKIHLLTTPTANPKLWAQDIIPGAPILAGTNLVDDVLLFYGRDIMSPHKIRALRARIRDFDPEQTFLVPQSGERVSGILKKILFLRILGVHRNLSGYHLTKTLSFFKKTQFTDGGYDHQVTSALISVGGGKCESVTFPIYINHESVACVDKIWRETGLDNVPFIIGLFPGGKFEHKRWPVERFQALCNSFNKEAEVAFVIVGGEAEQFQARQLVAACSKPIVDFSGKTNLIETAEVLHRCHLYIGNDSGPAHIAAAMGTPCVTLFSSVLFPGFWEPWGERNIAIRHRVPCEYCFNESHCPTGTMDCVKGISVEEVLDAARKFFPESAITTSGQIGIRP